MSGKHHFDRRPREICRGPGSEFSGKVRSPAGGTARRVLCARQRTAGLPATGLARPYSVDRARFTAGPPRLLTSLPGAKPTLAPVAQGIEHRPPEAGAQVRILPGAPKGRQSRHRRRRGHQNASSREAASPLPVSRPIPQPGALGGFLAEGLPGIAPESHPNPRPIGASGGSTGRLKVSECA